MLATSDFARSASAVIGTAALSALCIGAAIAPAKAAPASFTQSVEKQIDHVMRYPAGARASAHGIATLAVTVGADGAAREVMVVKSSGDRALDREAVRTAHAVRYPANDARTIAMVLSFGEAPTEAARAEGGKLVTNYRRDNRQLLAKQTTATPTG